MPNTVSIDMSRYDQAFNLAYNLLSEHIKSGSAVTADIPTCLAELTEVIRKYGGSSDSLPQPEPRT